MDRESQNNSAVAAFFYLVLGFALSHTQGEYRFFPVLVVSVCLCLFYFIKSAKIDSQVRFKVFATIVFLFTIRMAHKPKILYIESNACFSVLRVFLVLSVLSAFLIFFKKLRVAGLLAGSVSLIVARFLVPFVSPKPRIDVFSTVSHATQYFLQGIKPYSQTYPDVYGGASGYVPGMLYPPGVIVALAPFQALFHDIRFGFVFADIMICLALYGIAKKMKFSREEGLLFGLLWLSFPVGLLVLEQTWIDTLLIMWIALTCFFLVSKRTLLAGLSLGMAAVTKQYSVFALAFTGVYFLSTVFEKKQRFFLILGILLSFLGVFLPFLVWDYPGLYHSIIEMPLHQSIRYDSFSLIALLHNELNFDVSGFFVLVFCGSVFLNFLVQQYRNPNLPQWARSNVVTYGSVFLLGRQAFCNYYQFLSFFLLLYLLASSSHE